MGGRCLLLTVGFSCSYPCGSNFLGIGILRCAAFSAAKKRPLLDQGNPDDSISHFHDKLLKLKGMMRTEQGRQAAEARHQTMLVFLDGIQNEANQFKLN